MKSEQDIIEYIEENEPTELDVVAQGLYEGDVKCDCCNRPHDEFEEFKDELGSILSDLVVANRLTTNVSWEYRTTSDHLI